MKVKDGWLVSRRLIPSAQRLPSKFNSFPGGLAAVQLFIFRTIFQLWALSINTPASRKGVYLF